MGFWFGGHTWRCSGHIPCLCTQGSIILGVRVHKRYSRLNYISRAGGKSPSCHTAYLTTSFLVVVPHPLVLCLILVMLGYVIPVFTGQVLRPLYSLQPRLIVLFFWFLFGDHTGCCLQITPGSFWGPYRVLSIEPGSHLGQGKRPTCCPISPVSLLICSTLRLSHPHGMFIPKSF